MYGKTYHVRRVILGLGVWGVEKEIAVEVRASKRYREDFVREIEEGVRDIVEGRVYDIEELYKKYDFKPREKS